MSFKEEIGRQIEQCHWIANSYLQDLTDADFMIRAVPGMNHIAWQLGHLIASSNHMLAAIGQPTVALPAGFEEAHGKETAGSDDRAKFAAKAVYLELAEKVKAASLAAVEAIPESKFGDPGPEKMRDYAPTVAAMLLLLGSHWMMHSGQFVAVRRKLGKPAMF